MKVIVHPIICPFCGTSQPLATALDGDFCFCFDCGEVSIFDVRHDLGAREPTKKEARLIRKSEQVARARAAWRLHS